ncbi:hypothetical protein CDQ92_08335 [Sphingopyxis bauzanensis]|uniref:Uncharacterized protein n=1 Tax=Sphingopyxis bauzanensis TaxID=651663 RepID=A0A246JVL7_9SPHN|nr:hypothetical protein CDQ92_08335 [Sphingopyxis bauzanensis]
MPTYPLEMTAGLEQVGCAFAGWMQIRPARRSTASGRQRGAIRMAMTGNPVAESFDLAAAQRTYSGRSSAEL